MTKGKEEKMRIKISTEVGENDNEERPEIYLVLETGEKERKILESVAVKSIEKSLYYSEGTRYGIKSFAYVDYGKQEFLFVKDFIDKGRARIKLKEEYAYQIPTMIEGIIAAFKETIRQALIGNKTFVATLNIHYSDE